MAEKFAVRNLRLCTKDCLCLYVCPTGATDTENSIIDVNKCIGCGDCAAACPSGAISMVPKKYPPQQEKTAEVIDAMRTLLRSKSEQENIAAGLPGRLAVAIEKSNRIMAEDIIREAGYLLPQNPNTLEFLQKLLREPPADDFPVANVKELIQLMYGVTVDEEAPTKWRCSICGYEHIGEAPPEKCPVCQQPASVFKVVTD